MFTKQIAAQTKIRSVSDGTRVGVGSELMFTKQIIAPTKIRSVSDGRRVGVGPHAN
jgi:hypothetical protein